MMNTNHYQTGPRAGQQIAAARLQAEREFLAEDLARWAGDEAQAAHDETVATGTSYGVPFRHGMYCCEQVREDAARNEWAFAMAMPMDALRRRHSAELTDRAVARAKRDGVLR